MRVRANGTDARLAGAKVFSFRGLQNKEIWEENTRVSTYIYFYLKRMKDNSSTNIRHREPAWPWVNMSTALCPAGRAGVLRAELGSHDAEGLMWSPHT